MKNTRLLIVVDESPTTRKALQYVAQMAAGRPNVGVCLAHALPSPPPELVEFRGAEKARLVEQYNLFVLEVLKAWKDPVPKNPKTIHHCGYGTFLVDGQTIKLKSKMR
jgi:hypothetical protein